MSAVALALSGCADPGGAPRPLAGADPRNGRAVAERLGCAACHEIPGLDWPKGRIGGSLVGFANRPLIAGRLPNQPKVLTQWLRDAPSLDPGVAMPAIPMSEADARDLAAFLYTLDD